MRRPKSKLLALLILILTFMAVCIPVSGQTAKGGAKLNGICFDYGIDENNNGLYEAIAIKVGISVFAPDNYTVSGLLYSANGSEVIAATNKSYLDDENRFVRNAYVVLKFYGAEARGQRYLRNLTLYDSRGNLLNQIDNAYLTKPYSNLESVLMLSEDAQQANLTENDNYLETVSLPPEDAQPANLTGYFKDYGTGKNGDRSYDLLTIEVGVNVLIPGEYTLDGSLYGASGSEIVWSLDHENLSDGYHVMKLNFDGKTISQCKIDGPYRLGDIELFSGSFDRGYTPCIINNEEYNTSAYKYADFAGAK